jgi:hypothetical protein
MRSTRARNSFTKSAPRCAMALIDEIEPPLAALVFGHKGLWLATWDQYPQRVPPGCPIAAPGTWMRLYDLSSFA